MLLRICGNGCGRVAELPVCGVLGRSPTTDENMEWDKRLENIYTVVFFFFPSLMLNIYLPYDLPILFLGNYPGKIKQMSLLRLAC